RAMLEQVVDEDLREELTPVDWTAQLERPDLPVVGISFSQVRTIAALSGFHVLADREFELAANAGIDALTFPWGPAFDPRNVAANPMGMNEPLPVQEKLSSASPHGILNLVGNVGEMLSPGTDGWEVPIAGGYFLSDEAELTCGSRTWLDRLTDSKGWAGVRLGRFVPRQESEATRLAVEERIADMFETGHPGVLADWTIRADGSMGMELRLLGNHSEDRPNSMGMRPLYTEGFAQRGKLEVLDGHGRPLESEQVVLQSREGSRFDVKLAGRKGQQFRLRLATDLEPWDGLMGRADLYSLHVPLSSLGQARTMTRVFLPPNSQVESVEPPVNAAYRDGDRDVLVWYADEGRVAQSQVPAIVRFRRDGVLADAWPTRESIESAIQRFVQAVGDGDRDVLEQMLAAEFRQKPHGRFRDKAIAAYSSPERRSESIGDWELLDAVPVGPVVTTWLRMDWQTTERNGEPVVLRDWPMRARLRRAEDGAGFQLLELAPAGRADTGALDEGVYRHAGLWVEFAPSTDAISQIVRLDRHMTDLQVKCDPRRSKSERQDGSIVDFALFGIQAPQDADPAVMKNLLTDGEWSMRQGVQLDESAGTALLGGLDYGRRAQVYDWHFPRPGGAWFRERWTLLTLGRRWFLARARTGAETKEKADALFRQYGEFFDKMALAVTIREKGFDQE
ncbi:MAG: SUMF1/EgtB/PvdO family nonheme iron enzyme, partial [Planctomycetes bacterium]|nr:SUMF1/EgtB/PvdO family nonheme iron enzyme [Planctomycetota bacterium]